MFKKASLQLAALAVLLLALSQGNPVTKNKDGIEAIATGDARIKPSNLLHFNHSWPFPSRPSVTDNKERRVGDLRKKVDALEKIQNAINEILEKLIRIVSELTDYCAVNDDGRPMVPTLPPIPDFTDFFADEDDREPMVPTLSSIPDFASFFADKRDGQRIAPALSPVPDFADARIKPSHLLNFNHSWSLPSLPSVTVVLGGANNKKDPKGDLQKRVAALEKIQKSINKILMKLNSDISVVTPCCLADGNVDLLLRTLSPIPDFADARIKPFNHTWSFPLLSSVTDVFNGADKNDDWVEDLQKSVDALKELQKSIYETLKSLIPYVSVLTAFCAEKDDGNPMVPAVSHTTGMPMDPITLSPIPDFTDFFDGKGDKKPMFPAATPPTTFATPHLPAGILPPGEKAANSLPSAVPLKAKGNATPNLSSDGSSTPEIPEKIVIASTSLEDSPGENPFGSIPS